MVLKDRVARMAKIIDKLVGYGFKVYYIPNNSYCHYVYEDKIGYTQVDSIGIHSITSVRKSSKEYGTGTRLQKSSDVYNGNRSDYIQALNYHYTHIPYEHWYKDESEWYENAYRNTDMKVILPPNNADCDMIGEDDIPLNIEVGDLVVACNTPVVREVVEVGKYHIRLEGIGDIGIYSKYYKTIKKI